MKRPSLGEVDKKLKEAKEALKNRRGAFASFEKVVHELMALHIDDTEDVWELIGHLIEEITIEDYAGSRPPQKSYEPKILGMDLWAFHWVSTILGKEMYLKFSVKNGVFYYVSLHESVHKKLKKLIGNKYERSKY